jgi:hypothetical protein
MLEPMALSCIFRISTEATNYAHELCRIPFIVHCVCDFIDENLLEQSLKLVAFIEDSKR